MGFVWFWTYSDFEPIQRKTRNKKLWLLLARSNFFFFKYSKKIGTSHYDKFLVNQVADEKMGLKLCAILSLIYTIQHDTIRQNIWLMILNAFIQTRHNPTRRYENSPFSSILNSFVLPSRVVSCREVLCRAVKWGSSFKLP